MFELLPDTKGKVSGDDGDSNPANNKQGATGDSDQVLSSPKHRS